MVDIIKGLLKWIKWIVCILLVGALVLAFRILVIDKDYNSKSSDSSSTSSSSSASSKSGKTSDSSANSKSDAESSNTNGIADSAKANSVTDTVDSNGISNKAKSLGGKIVNGAKSIGNATVRGYKEDEEYDYNAHNFDERFLMYEGEQYDGAVKNILEILISNSNENFYARTSVTAKNFGGNVTINYDGDVIEYQNAIRNLENEVSSGMYDVSFGYAGIMTYVNEIIITKK